MIFGDDLFGFSKPKKKKKSKTKKKVKKTTKKTKKKKRTAIPSGIKSEALKRSGGSCERCYQSLRGLKHHIHHRNHKPSDNRLDNLIVLCPNCHSKEHYKKDGSTRKAPKKKRGLFGETYYEEDREDPFSIF